MQRYSVKLICLTLLGIAFIQQAFIQQALAVEDNKPVETDVMLAKICTEIMRQDGQQYCVDGYVLKTVTYDDGSVKESVFMEDIGGYGWTHTGVGKLNKGLALLQTSCGTGCGGNIVVGLYDKEQVFGYFFDYHIPSQCLVAYDADKELWVAMPMSLDANDELPSTYGKSESAVSPKYNVAFNKAGQLEVSSMVGDTHIKMLANPCEH